MIFGQDSGEAGSVGRSVRDPVREDAGMSWKVYLRPSGHVAFMDRINPCRLAMLAQVSALTVAFGRPRCMMGRAPGT